jgi:integrase/recombinase XerD
MTDLHAAAGEYLAIRRALGFKLYGHDRLLEDFIAFLTDTAASTITTATAVAWATRPVGLQPVRYAQRLCAVRGFAAHLHALDAAVQIPPADLLPYRRWRRTPYLYSQADIDALMAAAGLLRPPLRAATYRGVFGLLAVTGMRVGEAIALDDADVDLDTGVLLINEAKFGKHRRLPVHPSTIAALRGYLAVRDQLCRRPRGSSLFVSTRGTRLIYRCAHTAFAQLLTRTAITAPAGTSAPTIHGLRHSFAVATLRDWYRAGVDVATKLPVLSAYLGHAHPASTYWYLSEGSGIPDLLALAAQRLEQAAGDR